MDRCHTVIRPAVQKAATRPTTALNVPECATTVTASIITAVNINLHPASSGSISPIILSCDRDKAALGEAATEQLIFWQPITKGLFGACC